MDWWYLITLNPFFALPEQGLGTRNLMSAEENAVNPYFFRTRFVSTLTLYEGILVHVDDPHSRTSAPTASTRLFDLPSDTKHFEIGQES